ncbi:MAG: hypothetical protein RLZZ502_171, partial [Pseudomonadota bacterium]
MTFRLSLLALALTTALTVQAQTQTTANTNTNNKDTDKKTAEKKSEDKKPEAETVTITGRNTANDERRNSTAAKIIITREDIEQYGDSNLGDVMRRLPGVTQGGRPGRGGPIRMRGMGGGYTQILIDGQRIQPGFNVEDISPEQVERIEILRAPTAETGARAVAGTINIILREPLRTTHNEPKLGVVSDRGKLAYNGSWAYNDKFGEAGTYTLNASLNHNHTLTDSLAETVYTDAASEQLRLLQHTFNQTEDKRDSYFLSTRAQWRLGVAEQLGLMGFVHGAELHNQSRGTLTQEFGALPAPYATRSGRYDGDYQVARLNLNINKKWDDNSRYEWRFGGGQFQST